MIKFVLKVLFICLPAFFVYSAQAQVIGTFAGSGILSAYSGDGGASFFAVIGYTWHVAADTSGNNTSRIILMISYIKSVPPILLPHLLSP